MCEITGFTQEYDCHYFPDNSMTIRTETGVNSFDECIVLCKVSSSLISRSPNFLQLESDCAVFTFDEVRLECRLMRVPPWGGGQVSSQTDRTCGSNDQEQSGRFCTIATECRPRVCEECDTTGYTRHEGCTWPNEDLLDSNGDPVVIFNVLGEE